jgi:ubiquinone/menaquinone biosynthesis C-methylase UbiE
MPKRIIYGSMAIGIALSVSSWWLNLLAIPAALLLLVALYLAYVRYQFSPGGGGIQNSVWALALENLVWDGTGTALDIGCGNGALAIELAKEHPGASVLGVDYWGRLWEYSKETCESNARIEGVDDRVSFQKANAVSLPFGDGHFDAAVSNLVFHDVGEAKDKRPVIREALRVVKKGGSFSFQDEFLVKSLFGDPDDLIATIRSWGVEKVELIRTCDADFIPRALKLPLFLGTIAVIAGRK